MLGGCCARRSPVCILSKPVASCHLLVPTHSPREVERRWTLVLYVLSMSGDSQDEALCGDVWWDAMSEKRGLGIYKTTWNVKVRYDYQPSKLCSTRLTGSLLEDQQRTIMTILLKTADSKHMVSGNLYLKLNEEIRRLEFQHRLYCTEYLAMMQKISRIQQATCRERELLMKELWNYVNSKYETKCMPFTRTPVCTSANPLSCDGSSNRGIAG